MKNILILFLLITGIISKGQNLVPNPGFETFSLCPTNYSQVYKAAPWFQPCIHNGNTTNSCSTDLFNSCNTGIVCSVPSNFAGYQTARTGVSYAGIHVYPVAYEYLEVPLISPLTAGTSYCVSFYVTCSQTSNYGIGTIGAYFSNDSILDTTSYHILNLIPQVEHSDLIGLIHFPWMLVSGSFIAAGGEKFMTIGNFRALPTIYYVGTGGPTPDIYYYVEDVTVADCNLSGWNEPENESTITIYPNPFTNQTIITFSETQKNITIKITDVLGKEIRTINFSGKQLTIEKGEMKPGIYFVQITDSSADSASSLTSGLLQVKNVMNKKIIIQ